MCGILVSGCSAKSQPATGTGADTAADHVEISILTRPRSGFDDWPSFAFEMGPRLNLKASRRLKHEGQGEFGLWLAPTAADGALGVPGDVAHICLRVVPLTGPDRGRGGSSCAPRARFSKDPRLLLILSGGKRGIRGIAPPHDLILAGVTRPDVRRIELGLADRRTMSLIPSDQSFLIHTTRIVRTIRYVTSVRTAPVVLNTCQLCDLPVSPPAAAGNEIG